MPHFSTFSHNSFTQILNPQPYSNKRLLLCSHKFFTLRQPYFKIALHYTKCNSFLSWLSSHRKSFLSVLRFLALSGICNMINRLGDIQIKVNLSQNRLLLLPKAPSFSHFFLTPLSWICSQIQPNIEGVEIFTLPKINYHD